MGELVAPASASSGSTAEGAQEPLPVEAPPSEATSAPQVAPGAEVLFPKPVPPLVPPCALRSPAGLREVRAPPRRRQLAAGGELAAVVSAPGRRGVIWPVPSCLALNGPFDFPSWEMFALPPSVSVARLRKRWTLSPMNSSASVDHTPVGAQVRRRNCNLCNPCRSRGTCSRRGRHALLSDPVVGRGLSALEEGDSCI